ncbi:MAG: hypothetical protein ACREBC_07895, partial [Pyrinomonadaceae bacterium]
QQRSYFYGYASGTCTLYVAGERWKFHHGSDLEERATTSRQQQCWSADSAQEDLGGCHGLQSLTAIQDVSIE